MVDKEVLDFIKEGSKDGFSLDELREKLKEVDIKDKEIDSAIEAFKKEHSREVARKKREENKAKAEMVSAGEEKEIIRNERVRVIKSKTKTKKVSGKKAKKSKKIKKKVGKRIKRSSKRRSKKKKKVPKKIKTVRSKVRRSVRKIKQKKHSRKEAKKKIRKKKLSKADHKRHIEAKRAIDKAIRDLEIEILNSTKEKKMLQKEIGGVTSSINEDRKKEVELEKKVSELMRKEIVLKQRRKTLQAKVTSINNKLGKITRLKSEISDMA